MRVGQRIKENIGFANKTTNEDLAAEFTRFTNYIAHMKHVRIQLGSVFDLMVNFHAAHKEIGDLFAGINKGVDPDMASPMDKAMGGIASYHESFGSITDKMVIEVAL